MLSPLFAKKAFVNIWFTFPTTKKDKLSRQMDDTENEQYTKQVSIFVAESLTLKTDAPDGIELGGRKKT